MTFDLLAAMVERWQPQFVPVLDAAVLIALDLIPHKGLPKSIPAETLPRIEREFRLPYRVVAIEDPASCVVLIDQEPRATGLRAERLYLDCQRDDPGTREEAFNLRLDERLRRAERLRTRPTGACIVTAGTAQVVMAGEARMGVLGGIEVSLIGTPEALDHPPDWLDRDPEARLRLLGSALGHVQTAIEELMYIEAQPEFDGWPQRADERLVEPTRVRRSCERPVLRVGQMGGMEL